MAQSDSKPQLPDKEEQRRVSIKEYCEKVIGLHRQQFVTTLIRVPESSRVDQLQRLLKGLQKSWGNTALDLVLQDTIIQLEELKLDFIEAENSC